MLTLTWFVSTVAVSLLAIVTLSSELNDSCDGNIALCDTAGQFCDTLNSVGAGANTCQLAQPGYYAPGTDGTQYVPGEGNCASIDGLGCSTSAGSTTVHACTGDTSQPDSGPATACRTDVPTAAPTAVPTAVPTAAPTEYVLVIPSWVGVIGTLSLVFCVCFALCCCRKGEGYKKKIYEMMEEAKIDVDNSDLEHGDDDDDDDDDFDDDETNQITPVKNMA